VPANASRALSHVNVVGLGLSEGTLAASISEPSPPTATLSKEFLDGYRE